jgi:hypothetical protein
VEVNSFVVEFIGYAGLYLRGHDGGDLGELG